MPSSSLLWSVGSLALSSMVLPATASSYELIQSWKGEDFLDLFDFYTGADPTNGFVTYANQSYAESSGLVRVNSNGSFYMGVDHTTKLSTSGPGRESVRIESNKYYDQGLFVIDLAHMPGSVCGTWPAFWSTGANWPDDGEIDIIEGVNKNEANEIVLHTSGTCDVSSQTMTGTLSSTQCGEDAGTGGCVVKGTEGSSGTQFNENGGGVYAMEWTDEYLKFWFFTRDAVPDSITKGSPDVTKFGTPMAHMQGSCDFSERFKSQKFIFDTTFCGDWAGGVYSTSGCPVSDSSSSFKSCTAYVAENPTAFEQTYWEINSIEIYQTGANATAVASGVSSAAAVSETASAVSEATESVAATTAPVSAAASTAADSETVTDATTPTTTAAVVAGASAADESSSSVSKTTKFVTLTTTYCPIAASSSAAAAAAASSASEAANNAGGSAAAATPSTASGASAEANGGEGSSASEVAAGASATPSTVSGASAEANGGEGTSPSAAGASAAATPSTVSGASAEANGSEGSSAAASPSSVSGVSAEASPSEGASASAASPSSESGVSADANGGEGSSSPAASGPSRAAAYGGSSPSSSVSVPSGMVRSSSAVAANSAPTAQGSSSSSSSSGTSSSGSSGSGSSSSGSGSSSSSSSATTPATPYFTGAANKLSFSASGLVGALVLAMLA